MRFDMFAAQQHLLNVTVFVKTLSKWSSFAFTLRILDIVKIVDHVSYCFFSWHRFNRGIHVVNIILFTEYYRYLRKEWNKEY